MKRLRRPVGLEEALYYAVREAQNCVGDPTYREPDERILPALDILAAADRAPDNPYVCRISIISFCQAMVRRGRWEDLKRIKWLGIPESESVPRQPRQLSLFGEG